MAGNEISIKPKYEYPYEHAREMERKYIFINPRIWFGMEYRKEPPMPRQLSLFPTLEEQIIVELPNLPKRGKHQSTRIKWLAKKFEIPIPLAKRKYKVAMSILRAQVLYEEYCRFKDYFDWKETPEFHQYCKAYLAELEAKRAEELRIFNEKIARGEEHVVWIGELDHELNDILDNHIDCYQRGQCPASFLAKRMTRHDFEVLNSRGLIEVLRGDPATLKDHPYLESKPQPKEEPVSAPNVYYCQCGEILDYNIIGLNKKLGAYNDADFKCLRCLEMTEEEAHNIINYYKSSGCTLFN